MSSIDRPTAATVTGRKVEHRPCHGPTLYFADISESAPAPLAVCHRRGLRTRQLASSCCRVSGAPGDRSRLGSVAWRYPVPPRLHRSVRRRVARAAEPQHVVVAEAIVARERIETGLLEL